MRFKPAPGIFVVEPLEEQASTDLNLGSLPDAKIKKGKIIAKGDNLTTDFGVLKEMDKYGKVGDYLYFLSYDGGYDVGNVGTKKYHFVKLDDVRCRVYTI